MVTQASDILLRLDVHLPYGKNMVKPSSYEKEPVSEARGNLGLGPSYYLRKGTKKDLSFNEYPIESQIGVAILCLLATLFLIYVILL